MNKIMVVSLQVLGEILMLAGFFCCICIKYVAIFSCDLTIVAKGSFVLQKQSYKSKELK